MKERLATYYFNDKDEVIFVDSWTRKCNDVNRSGKVRVREAKRRGGEKKDDWMTSIEAWKTCTKVAQVEITLQLAREVAEEEDNTTAPKVMAWVPVSETVGDFECRVFGKDPENGCQSFQKERGNFEDISRAKHTTFSDMHFDHRLSCERCVERSFPRPIAEPEVSSMMMRLYETEQSLEMGRDNTR